MGRYNFGILLLVFWDLFILFFSHFHIYDILFSCI